MRLLYTVLFYLAHPLIVTRLLWRSVKLPLYRKRILERFGFCPHQLESCIWLHAVSVGESIAAIPLIKALKKEYPTLPILVTSMTPTGAQRIKAALGEEVLQAYIPYDLPDAVARFLAKIKPKIAIIMETELWPNLFFACQKRAIPIVVANARLSAKSQAGYKKFPQLTRQLLSAVTKLASQGYADAERFSQLGLAKERILVTGNLKFDIEVSEKVRSEGALLRKELGENRPVWIAASTHPGEEEIILSAHQAIQTILPNALLILVPRHPDRFKAVATLVEQQGCTLIKRSQSVPCASDTSVYLGDTMGEMLLLYAAADIAVVAGSFVPVGGHNMLEAAVLEKPILTGPHLFNFAEISQMLMAAKGMEVVKNGVELADKISQLLQDVAARHVMGASALQVVDANRGALQKQIALIKEVLH